MAGKKVALKGDKSEDSKAIKSDVSEGVKINGKLVALKGSRLEDNSIIQSEVTVGVTINKKKIALDGSKTDTGKLIKIISSTGVTIGTGGGGGGEANSAISALFSNAPVTGAPKVSAAQAKANENTFGHPVANLPQGDGAEAPSVPDASDIVPFLQSCLKEAAQWTRGQAPLGPGGNQNIMQCFKDAGWDTSKYPNNDKVAWCAAFVNFALKRCGYYATGDLGVAAFLNNPGKWHATVIYNGSGTGWKNAAGGDLAIWTWPGNPDPSHIAFVLSNNGNSLTICGGNQSGKDPQNNNPLNSTVSTFPYSGASTLKAILRPAKRS
jgi:uncharacterized Zn-binding protein involved in type VI secretion